MSLNVVSRVSVRLHKNMKRLDKSALVLMAFKLVFRELTWTRFSEESRGRGFYSSKFFRLKTKISTSSSETKNKENTEIFFLNSATCSC